MSRQVFEYHPRTAYRFIPGVKARILHQNGGYLVKANQCGFRCNHEFVPELHAGLKRVLLFGDSFTAGDGVSNEQRYGDHLEKQFPNLEVYNFGLPGTGTDQQYLAWQEFGTGLAHDLLVIAVLVENVRRNAARYRTYLDNAGQMVCYAKPYFDLIDNHLVLRNVPAPKMPIPLDELPESEQAHVDRGGRFKVLRSIIAHTGMKELIQKTIRYQPHPEYEEANHPAWKLTAAILTEWITKSKCPVLLVPLPLYYHIEDLSDARGYQSRFRELAEMTRCHYHDPLPDLGQYSMKERRDFRFGEDCHYTPDAHRALAVSLAPAVSMALKVS